MADAVVSAGVQDLLNQIKGIMQQAITDNLETSKQLIPVSTEKAISASLPKQ